MGMTILQSVLADSTYHIYIWPSYVIALGGLFLLGVFSYRAKKKTETRLREFEKKTATGKK